MMETMVQIMRDMRVFLMLVNFLKVKKARGRVMRSNKAMSISRYLIGRMERQKKMPRMVIIESIQSEREILEIRSMILVEVIFFEVGCS